MKYRLSEGSMDSNTGSGGARDGGGGGSGGDDGSEGDGSTPTTARGIGGFRSILLVPAILVGHRGSALYAMQLTPPQELPGREVIGARDFPSNFLIDDSPEILEQLAIGVLDTDVVSAHLAVTLNADFMRATPRYLAAYADIEQVSIPFLVPYNDPIALWRVGREILRLMSGGAVCPNCGERHDPLGSRPSKGVSA